MPDGSLTQAQQAVGRTRQGRLGSFTSWAALVAFAAFALWALWAALSTGPLRTERDQVTVWGEELAEVGLLLRIDPAAAQTRFDLIRPELEASGTAAVRAATASVHLGDAQGSAAVDALRTTLRARGRSLDRRLDARWLALQIVVGAAVVLGCVALALSFQDRRRTVQLAGLHERLSDQLRTNRQVLSALKASERRYALAVAGAQDALWDWDLVTGEAYFAPRWAEMVGRSVLGLSDAQVWLSRVHPADSDATHAALDAHLRGDTPHFVHEHRVRTDAGGWRWVLARGVAQRDEAGAAIRITGALTDITRMKESEQVRDEFIAAVSHELRTPLTGLLGSLGLVATGVFGELPPRVLELLQISERSGARLLVLINDLLDVARIQAGELPIRPEDVDAGRLLDEAVEVNPTVGSARGVTFAVKDAHPGVLVHADPNRLIQVLTNLMTNAAKYGPEDSEVMLTMLATPSSVRLCVVDSGPGIPDEHRERVFERFGRVDTDTMQGGAGLGLAISKAIVDAHGGRIDFEPAPGGGTCFYVELPRAGSSSRVSPSAPI